MRIAQIHEHDVIRSGEIPTHLACIMDGNGRWAQMRNLGRSAGHAAAEATVDAVVDACIELGVSWLTVYAFSTENWQRDEDEVKFLMNFRKWLLRKGQRQELIDKGVRFRFIGDIDDDRISRPGRAWLQETQNLSESNTQLNLCIAFNYGGRAEMVRAAKALHAMSSSDDIDETAFQNALYCPEMPDIDLVIRTSSEQRLSNFMPWHSAYAEFLFIDTLWPDIRSGHIYSAIAEYQTRERRKGGIVMPNES